MRALRFAPPRAPLGAYLVVPGLHYEGPDDPRLDRFCRILSSAGYLVLAPFLVDWLALRLAPTVIDDLGTAFDALEGECRAVGLPSPAIFSISFGSAPAIALAAREGYAHRVAALLLFGGFCDFRHTVRFNLTGRTEYGGVVHTLPRDPLNAPVVFMNLLDGIDAGAHREVLREAWRAQTHRTWGKMELKAPGALEPIASAAARELPESARDLFLVGCGVRPGAPDILERAFVARGDALDFMEARPYLRSVRAPVVAIHGRDDDVIPYFESMKVVDAFPPGYPARLRLTGLYAHTGAGTPDPRRALHEAKDMIGILRDFAGAPTRAFDVPRPPGA